MEVVSFLAHLGAPLPDAHVQVMFPFRAVDEASCGYNAVPLVLFTNNNNEKMIHPKIIINNDNNNNKIQQQQQQQ